MLLKAQEVEPVELDFLLRYPFVTNLQSPVDFLSDTCWGGIVALSSMNEFKYDRSRAGFEYISDFSRSFTELCTRCPGT